MVNNTAQDQTPYFMTANHCGINSGTAASLVVYWNYKSPTCGLHGGGSLSQWQNGSYWRAAYSTSDFTLVELDDDPNPAYNVTFAGWDRTTADPTSAVAIHHPSCDEKSISFENDGCTTTSYLGTSSPGNGTHIRVIDWDLGTTEPGSSGSPLFDPNHHVVGQLHGGYAACGNDLSDWYGKFSVSWTGGGTSSSRLSDWLDPGGAGAVSVDTLVPGGCDNDGVCKEGEDCNNCPNDCISSEGGGICGNGVCEPTIGEDCLSCPVDCNGKQVGTMKRQFCCGDGDGANPVGCDDPRCTSQGYACGDPPEPYCCGDGVCEGAEDGCNCYDCGYPPISEIPGETCSDGIDNDCDGGADCDDPTGDCDSDPYCQPACDYDGVCEPGEDCNNCPNDCDGKRIGKPSGRFCCGNGLLEGAEGDGSICDGNP
jgi:hypothetical protein